MSNWTTVGVVHFFTGRMTVRTSFVVVRFKYFSRLKYEQSEVWLLEIPAGKKTTNQKEDKENRIWISKTDVTQTFNLSLVKTNLLSFITHQ